MSLSKKFLVTIALLLSPTLTGAVSSFIAAYPIPAAESIEFATNWLREEGFKVSQTVSDAGKATLIATRGEENIRIGIRPQSPLGALVEFSCAPAATDEHSTINALKASLEGYVLTLEEGIDPVPSRIPEAVKAIEHSVTCLKASVKGEAVHFSGFVVDRQGLIVSTAHDLDGINNIFVEGDGGKEIPGEVVKRDTISDLTLIKVKKRFSSAVTVPAGKRHLEAGERIYMVRCSRNNHDDVKVGIVSRQQAVVSGKLLWQVKMDVSPGSSGSPVFDQEGRLVGVAKGRYRGTETRGFLIPLDTIVEFLGQEKR